MAADNKINIKGERMKVEQALDMVKGQTGFYFMYEENSVNKNKLIDLNLSNVEIRQAMDEISRKADFSYEIMENYILIKKRSKSKPTASVGNTKASPEQIEKTEISGKVVDKSNLPLPGTTVRLQGTDIFTTTNAEGKFTLAASDLVASVLEFSFLGMKKQTVRYKGMSMTVTMEEEIAEIQELVVTGIFTKARESYTGAVSTITSDELLRVGNSNVLTQIRNIDPSFNLLENNIYGSDPNRLPDIQMRGSTSLTVGMKELQQDNLSQSNSNLPLFVVDGFTASLQQVIDMDAYLVESITLLKDASATAIYGARGANGVVVVTTKKPADGALRITYKGDLNVEAPDLTSYSLLNAQEKLEYEVFAGIYEQGTPSINQKWRELYQQRYAEVARGVDTYWLKYPVRVGVGNRHSLRFDGGDDKFRYAMNLNYNNVVGAMKGSNRTTVSGSMFLQYRYKNFTFRNELLTTFNQAGNSPYGSFSQYTLLNPYWTPYDEAGNLKKMLENRTSPEVYRQGNPLYDAELPYLNENKYDQFRDNFAMEWRFSPDFTARGRLSITKQTGRSDIYTSAKHSMFEGEDYTGENYARRGSYRYGTDYLFMYEADITINYSKVLQDKHTIYAGMNYSVSEEKTESHTISAEGYTATNMFLLGIANAYEKNGKPVSSEGLSRRLGGLLNVNYTYDKRYFIDISGKMDASSKFGTNKRTAPFWSAGIGWNVHHEKFLSESDLINSLRLRLSYGTTGSQNFSPYQAMTIFHYLPTNYRYWTGFSMVALGNEDLKWQSTGQANMGFDVEFWNKRIRINFDVYNKDTDNMLADINVPTASGFSSYKANIGKVRNRGLELALNAYLLRNREKGITWSIGGNLMHNKNTVLKISDALDALNDEINDNDNVNPSFLVKEGQSLNTIFAVQSLGIDPSTGAEVLLKKDGTKVFGSEWNSNDKVPCGVAEPKIWGTFNTMFRYKNVSFDMVFGYRAGGDIYNQTLVDKLENVDPRLNVDKRAFYDRWKQPGDQAKYKGASYFKTATGASSRFVMRENTLECRTIKVSYELANNWLHKTMKIENLMLAAYTEDIFRFSTIKQERGTSYPFSRKYSLALTVHF
jgi:TonB-linked SusC/RagA family outer membrane protein